MRLLSLVAALLLIAAAPAHGSGVTVADRIEALPGENSLDAVSPDGNTIYVIHYLSRDHTHYEVQWFDARAAHPRPHTLVEKGEPGEEMAGNVLSRTSKDEWTYTL